MIKLSLEILKVLSIIRKVKLKCSILKKKCFFEKVNFIYTFLQMGISATFILDQIVRLLIKKYLLQIVTDSKSPRHIRRQMAELLPYDYLCQPLAAAH